jgi:hypothetical protein
MTTTTTDRRKTAAKMAQRYLEDWDRQEWMSDHGEWASAEWDDAREEYVARAAEAVEAADDEAIAVAEAAEAAEAAAEAADDAEARAAAAAATEAADAARSLADAVEYLSDDGENPDYPYAITDLANTADSLGLTQAAEALRAMAEAAAALNRQVTPDNDYIAEGRIDPDDVADEDGTVVWAERWQGWDCMEGQEAILLDDGRVVAHWWRDAYGCGCRHDRDLWIVVGELEDDA